MLDENRHLNNCVYADLLFDYAKNTYVSPSIQIDFCGEAHKDDIITVYIATGENFDFLSGFNETRGKKCFDAIIRERTNIAAVNATRLETETETKTET
ncbi:hypothetical protein SDC9_140611 [bioreactor metagenome]|uniref:Acyl-ACP thioesterase-like C-terminal domain-containing protein n=1 Tax=bioreactor metagenome TaxID=1076179 RepID=A0A645DVD7_9ZZZZ